MAYKEQVIKPLFAKGPSLGIRLLVFAVLGLRRSVGLHWLLGFVPLFVLWAGLRVEPRALRRTRGLTTRTDVAVPVKRVQAAILITGWFRRS